MLINHLCLWTKEDISFQRPCHNPHMFGPSNTKTQSINKCTELVIVHVFNILHMFVYSKIHIEMKHGWTIFYLLTASFYLFHNSLLHFITTTSIGNATNFDINYKECLLCLCCTLNVSENTVLIICYHTCTFQSNNYNKHLIIIQFPLMNCFSEKS